MGIHSVGTSDAALVRRVQAGDTGAYADLVARYRDRLGRYALRMLGNREDAEEVLQDSFVRAYRSLARCDDPEPLPHGRRPRRAPGAAVRTRPRRTRDRTAGGTGRARRVG